jgi:Spy/CpxP family protein refolding chaperone
MQRFTTQINIAIFQTQIFGHRIIITKYLERQNFTICQHFICSGLNFNTPCWDFIINRRRITRNAHALALGLALIGTFASAHDASRPEVEYHPTTATELHAIIDQIRQGAAPEQAKAIDAIETGAEADLDRLGQAAIKAHHHKVGVLLQDKPDSAAFERAQAGELRAETALAKRVDQVLVALAKTLTPEQRAQFRAHNGE